MTQTINPAPQHAPTRLLRCRKTHRYFTDNGWSTDPSQAKTFCDQIDAVRDCVFHSLHTVDLVLRLAGASTDLFTTRMR